MKKPGSITYEEVAANFGLPVVPADTDPYFDEEGAHTARGYFLNALRLVESMADVDMGFDGTDFSQAVEHVVREELEIPPEMPSEGIRIDFCGYSSGYAAWGWIRLLKGDSLTRLLQSFSVAYDIDPESLVNMSLENYIARKLGYSFQKEQPENSLLRWYDLP